MWVGSLGPAERPVLPPRTRTTRTTRTTRSHHGRTPRVPGIPARAHRRRRARARRRPSGGAPDHGAGPRRVPRRGQRRRPGGPAPRRPRRGPGGGDLRRRPVPRLPRPAPRDVVRAGPLRGVRRPAAGGPAAARHRRDAVPAAPGARAGQPVGGVHPGRARGGRALQGDPGRQHGLGADGGAAHPPDRDHPPRQRPRPADRRERVARRAADPQQRPGLAGGPARGVGARSDGLRGARTTSPSSTTPRPPRRSSSTSRRPAG